MKSAVVCEAIQICLAFGLSERGLRDQGRAPCAKSAGNDDKAAAIDRRLESRLAGLRDGAVLSDIRPAQILGADTFPDGAQGAPVSYGGRPWLKTPTSSTVN